MFKCLLVCISHLLFSPRSLPRQPVTASPPHPLTAHPLTRSPLRSFVILVAVFSIHVAPLCSAEESRIVSWNSHSRQFIDPPAFQLLPLVKTVKYRAIVEQGGQSWAVESTNPWLDLSPIWGQVPVKSLKLIFRWLDADGKVLAEESSWRVKAPIGKASRNRRKTGRRRRTVPSPI